MSKILWVTEDKWMDQVLIDVMQDAGYKLTIKTTPDDILNGKENLDEYSHIVVTMFLAVGEILSISRCVKGTKTGIVLLAEIIDKLKSTKAILRVLSSFEISSDEFEWCKSHNVIVVNEMVSRYNTILNIVQNKESFNGFQYSML